MIPHCDVVTINCPLHPETEHMFDDAMLAKMKVFFFCLPREPPLLCSVLTHGAAPAAWRLYRQHRTRQDLRP